MSGPSHHGRAILGVEALEERATPATIAALTTTQDLVTFDSATPGVIAIKAHITGLRAFDAIIGIDVRPATGELYGVGRIGGIYTIDAYTGVAKLKTTLVADVGDTTAKFVRLQGTSFGVDFNPVVDRLRIVSDFDNNYRVNVDTGATFTDTKLAFAAGDVNVNRNPYVTGSAYENPDNNPATGTTLRNIDAIADALVTQNPANDGTLTTVGKLGVNVFANVGFDIGLDSTAYAAMRLEGETTSRLFTINLASGAAAPVGVPPAGSVIVNNVIGGGEAIRSIAVSPPLVQFSRAFKSVREDATTVPFAIIRTGDTTGAVTVNVAVTEQTATAGADFNATSGAITFAAGETTKTLSIQILEDTLREGNETLSLTLTTPAGGGGATLRGRLYAELLIDDDDDFQFFPKVGWWYWL